MVECREDDGADLEAIAISSKAFPHDIAVFAFDNSSGHACKAHDALAASRKNLGPGVKQPLMRPTVLPDGTEQSMAFKATDCNWDFPGFLIGKELIEKPKGMNYYHIAKPK